MVFSKQKMIDRITREGKSDMLDDEALAIMDNLDGCEASAYNWENIVMDQPLMWVIGRNGKGEYVNEQDCI